MRDKFDNTAIALAGLVQAISLVQELAQTGKVDQTLFETSIRSIFATNPPTIAATFGGVEGVKFGLEHLLKTLSPKSKKDHTAVRYLLSLMSVQKKISRSKSLVATLSQRINQAKKQADFFSPTHPNVIANLADIYVNAIRPFRIKFFIAGNSRALSTQDTVEKIRALLLAAIRAAALWRQTGGSRLQLLFFHKKIKTAAENLLRNLL